MRLVVFGLTVSSSWGNGHATLWRGLCAALAARGHVVTFFERDVPYYAAHRDLTELPGGRLVLYREWRDVQDEATRAVSRADASIVTSYCPDARIASQLVLASSSTHGVKVFYDLDSPVTLARVAAGEDVEYLPLDGLGAFDLVISYAAGPALTALRLTLGARRVEALCGSVDPTRYQPGRARASYDGALSYLGTYAADRHQAFECLFLEPARRQPSARFVIGGSKYPLEFGWLSNVYYVRHVPPGDHPDFYASSRFTLNVTRGPMARLGYCPSGRLFEAAACGAAVLTDEWAGLEEFFDVGDEVIAVRGADDVLAALDLPEAERRRVGEAARARVLRAHTAAHRAEALEMMLAR